MLELVDTSFFSGARLRSRRGSESFDCGERASLGSSASARGPLVRECCKSSYSYVQNGGAPECLREGLYA